MAWAAQSELVLVTEENNGELRVSSYVLQEDDFHHPRLELLRSREKLDRIVAAGQTQFEKILLLRRWVRSQWEESGSFYYPPWDAVEILDLARAHNNRGFCAQYAVVFLQACQSLGIHARYVDLPGHFEVAVWSDDYDRWVLMDPTHDLHYEKDGLPMRGRDLYNAYWMNDAAGIVEVDSRGGRKAVTRDELDLYRLYSIDVAADQLTRPVEVTINGLRRTLVHASDYRTYPRVGKDDLVIGSQFLAWRTKEAGESFPERPETRDQDDFRYALNQTVVLLANDRLADRILKIALLSSSSSTFERFLVRSDESAGWISAPSMVIKWVLHPGANLFSARIETTFGWEGSPSWIKVYYKPPLFRSLPSFQGYIIRLLWSRSD
jgi:transglutaminase superfamily protein